VRPIEEAALLRARLVDGVHVSVNVSSWTTSSGKPVNR
jgi:hypothetical protein